MSKEQLIKLNRNDGDDLNESTNKNKNILLWIGTAAFGRQLSK